MSLEQTSKWIALPESDNLINHIHDNYRTIGFPGCIGSIDCVYFFGIAVLRTTHSVQGKGKEKAPTCAFLSHCFMYKRVISVSNVHFGCDNDKTIARFDAAISNLRKQTSIWSISVREYYYKEVGTVRIEKGF